MLAAFLIVFRESLEAALIISIVMAASRGIPGRTPWVAAGLLAGLLGAGLLGMFADGLSSLAGGVGNERFIAIALLLAAVIRTWSISFESSAWSLLNCKQASMTGCITMPQGNGL